MLVQIKKHAFTQDFTCENGFVLKQPVMCYEEYGNPNGPVIVTTHGGLSSQHNAGKYQESDVAPGNWDELIGSGKVIDTDIYRVISPNALGSMFGTTSPKTVNPDTGSLYGPSFPEINFSDSVRFLKAFLDELKIQKIYMILGPSMGSLHGLMLAAFYPDFVGSVASVATAGRITPGALGIHNLIINLLQSDPYFNGGHYQLAKMRHALAMVHQVSRIYYTHHQMLNHYFYQPAMSSGEPVKQADLMIQSYLETGIDEQIKDSDPNCYIRLLKALNTYDLSIGSTSYEEGAQRIQCPVLLINLETDSEFPPEWALELEKILNKKRPGQAQAVILPSIWGHIGCIKETKAISAYLAQFMKKLH